jgi:hypothetical protein
MSSKPTTQKRGGNAKPPLSTRGGAQVHARTGSGAASFYSPTAPLLTPPSRDLVVDTSRLTGFVHRTGFRVMYALLLVLSFFALRAIIPWQHDAAVVLTILLQAHALITFILLHWLRGAPESTTDGDGEDVAHLTFWEQMDERYYGTPSRRFFTLVPILLFFFTLIFTAENVRLLLMNALSTAVIVVAKHETLFGVRIFGINRGPE